MSGSSGNGDQDLRGQLSLETSDRGDGVYRFTREVNQLSQSLEELTVTAQDKNNDMTSASTEKDIDFDTVIGYLEDMLIDDEFHDLQLRFLEKYWEEFVENEENKHEYMSIFMEYTNEIEAFINKYIRKLIPHFEMEALIMELEKRKGNLDGEVFEVLFTLTDFSIFKEMFLDYRTMKEGNAIDVGQSLYVSPIQ